MNHDPDPLASSVFAEEMFTVNFTEAQIARFWASVDQIIDPAKCWNWKKCLDKRGYAKMCTKVPGTRKSKHHTCSRVSYFLTFGPFPARLNACHKCDNPKCVNPHHIFLGTQKENIHDMIRKGRKPHFHPNRVMGTRINTCKLTEDQVVCIRAMCEEGVLSQEKIGAMFGINQTAVSAIFRRKNWKQIK